MLRRPQWSAVYFPAPTRIALSGAFCNVKRKSFDEWDLVEMVTFKVNTEEKAENYLKSHLKSNEVTMAMFTFPISLLCAWDLANGIKADDDRLHNNYHLRSYFSFISLPPIISAIWIMAQRSWCHCWAFKLLLSLKDMWEKVRLVVVRSIRYQRWLS